MLSRRCSEGAAIFNSPYPAEFSKEVESCCIESLHVKDVNIVGSRK